MTCKIFRNYDTELIERVESPNGGDSTLFKEALTTLKDEDEALNVWAYAYTDSFKKSFGNWEEYPGNFSLRNSEPKLGDVLKHLNTNTTTEKLGIGDVLELHKLSKEIGTSIADLYPTLKSVFINNKGQFSINRTKLINSGIYTESEIKNLLEYPSVRGEVLTTMNKLKNSLLEDSELFETIPEESRAEFSILTGEVNVLGKEITLPESEVIDYLVRNLPPFTSDEQLGIDIENLNREDVRDALLSNPQAIPFVKAILENYQIVPVLSNQGGVYLPKVEGGTFETLRNTVTVLDSKIDITEVSDIMREIPEDSWYTEESELVVNALEEVENRAARHGLDLTGLRETFFSNSREEVLGILDIIDDFNTLTEVAEISEEDVREFSNDLDEYFGRIEVSEMKVIPTSSKTRGKEIYIIEGNTNETDIYRSEGFVKVKENLFQRVPNFNDFSTALESVYNLILQDVAILPKEVYKDVTTGYNVDVITNPENKARVMNSIKNYINLNPGLMSSEDMDDMDINREIVLMKTLYQIKPSPPIPPQNLSESKNSFSGDYLYLTTEFISDFNKKILEEKVIKKSEMYEKALKYFTINDKGIDLHIESEEIEGIRLILQADPVLYDNIVNYSLISKNPSLQAFREVKVDQVLNSIEDRRDFSFNYPETVQKVQEKYDRVSDSTVVMQNEVREFIRLNDGVYELTDYVDGVSVYSKLIGEVDSNFVLFNSSTPIIEDINLDEFFNKTEEERGRDVSNVSKNRVRDKQDRETCTI